MDKAVDPADKSLDRILEVLKKGKPEELQLFADRLSRRDGLGTFLRNPDAIGPTPRFTEPLIPFRQRLLPFMTFPGISVTGLTIKLKANREWIDGYKLQMFRLSADGATKTEVTPLNLDTGNALDLYIDGTSSPSSVSTYRILGSNFTHVSVHFLKITAKGTLPAAEPDYGKVLMEFEVL